MLVFDAAPPEPYELPGLTLVPRAVDNATAKLDLSLFLAATPAGLRGNFELDRALYDVTTLKRLAGHFRHLLATFRKNRLRSGSRNPSKLFGVLQTLSGLL